MFRNSTIRSILAFGLLLIFAFSVTPKRFLHDVFAGHSDNIREFNRDAATHVTQSGFNCDCNTLVATSPFTEQRDEIKIQSFTEYALLFTSLSAPVFAISHSFIELRGPPAIG